MAHLVRFSGPRSAEIICCPDPEPGPGEVLLRTTYSGISAGTELTAYRGTNPYLEHRWDPEQRLFVAGASTMTYPVDGWGYEEVGEVTAVGAEEDADLVGALVWGTWGHRSAAARPTEYVRRRRLQAGDDPMSGVFAKIGAIALNAVLDADIHVGETVVVFGAGVPGQIVAQLARLNGAHVIVVDPLDARRRLASELGAADTLDPLHTDVSAAVRRQTGNRGADVVIEMTGSYQALHEAIRCAGYSCRVVVSGFFQGPATALRLGEEFHHNRVSVVGSQISGVAPHLQHRWDELRMSETTLELARHGRLRLRELVSHVLPSHDAPEAFHLLDTSPHEALQIVLDFRETA